MILTLVAAMALEAAPVTISVSGLRNARGHVHVALCPKDKFITETCPYKGSAPAAAGVTMVTIPGVPAGDYAAQAFHDENDNQHMDRMFGSIPKEGFGFSRDAKVRFSPPAWSDAVFTHTAAPQAIRFGMRYMMAGK